MENFKLIEEKENPLFNRKEIQFKVQAKIAPSRAEIGKLISEKFSASMDNIEIKKIAGRFGSNIFDINSFVYKSKEDRMSTESKPKIIVEQKAEEKPEEEKETKEVEKPKETQEQNKEKEVKQEPKE